MVEELRREREASSLNIPELTTFIDGGEMFSERRKNLCKPILKLAKYLQLPEHLLNLVFAMCSRYRCERPSIQHVKLLLHVEGGIIR